MRPPSLAVPDLMVALVAELSQVLLVPASTEVPNPRPDRFVTVREIGGAGRTGLVRYRATVMYFGWGSSAQEARGLAAQARAVLFDCAIRSVFGVRFGPVRDVGAINDYPDPESAQARYAGTVEMVVREVPTG